MEIEKNSLTDYIKVYDNVMQEKPLNNFLRICYETNKFQEATTIQSDKAVILDKEIRNTLTWTPLNASKEYTEAHWCCFLQYLFTKYFNKYANDLNLTLKANIIDLQVLKYGNKGHYKFHVDSGAGVFRTLSLIFLLNEEYEGGDLVFKNPTNEKLFNINKKSNRIIVWPSNFLYPHSVLPVTNGTRYSVVSWAL
tara:strand:- start:1257 stop:1841 length:585 start_codon:yes stop_codon:yes gene_type:complete